MCEKAPQSLLSARLCGFLHLSVDIPVAKWIPSLNRLENVHLS